MFYFTLFFLEFFILFLLSRNLTQLLSQFIFRLSKNKHFTIVTLALLFFPGTLLHELAHTLFAGLLGVSVGDMEFLPKIEGEHVKLGSVQIARTDPVRRFIIGAAPLLFGMTILLGLLFFTTTHRLFTNVWWVFLIAYLVFEIGNTMFSSRKDMEGALELFATLILLVIIFYLLGVRIAFFNPYSFLSQPVVQEVFKNGSFFLLVPLIIDACMILLLRPVKKKQ